VKQWNQYWLVKEDLVWQSCEIFSGSLIEKNYFERKWDINYLKENYQLAGDVINASIADLDFLSPLPVRKTIFTWAEKGTYGTVHLESYRRGACKSVNCMICMNNWEFISSHTRMFHFQLYGLTLSFWTLFLGIVLSNKEFIIQVTAIMGQFEITTDGHRVYLTWMSRYKSVLFL